MGYNKLKNRNMEPYFVLKESVQDNNLGIWEEYRKTKKLIAFNNISFAGLHFMGYSFENVEMKSCTFSYCFFTSPLFKTTVLHNVKFLRCTFEGFVLYESLMINSVQMHRCKFVTCQIPKYLYRNRRPKIIYFDKCFNSRESTELLFNKKKITPLINTKDIELYQHRGRNIFKDGRCQVCGLSTTKLHLYRNTSVGEIEICKACEDEIQEINFGKIDGMDRAVQGGGFSPR